MPVWRNDSEVTPNTMISYITLTCDKKGLVFCHDGISARNHCSIQSNCSSNSQSGGEVSRVSFIWILNKFSECGSELSRKHWDILWTVKSESGLRELITLPEEKGSFNSSTSKHHLLLGTGSHPPLVLKTGGQDHSCGGRGNNLTQPNQVYQIDSQALNQA